MNPFRLLLIMGAFMLIQALVSGTRLVFALPAYALVALVGLLGVAGKRGGFSPPQWYCVASAFLLCGWVALRAQLSPIAYLAWPDLYMVVACLLLYAAFAWFLTSTRERLWLLGFLLLLAMAQFAVGIRQFTGNDDYMLLNLLRTPAGRRASGFFVHGISFAGYLEVIGIMALAFACWSQWRLEARLLIGFMSLLCYVGVAISGSRGGYLSVVLSVTVFFGLSLWMLARLSWRKFIVTLVVGLILLFAGGGVAMQLMSTNNYLRGRLLQLTEQVENARQLGTGGPLPQKAGWDIRIYNWQAALDQARITPWIGTGSGTHLYYARYFRRPQLQSDAIHAHSDYLELLAEYGIAGCIAMALFVGAHLLSGVRGARKIVEADLVPLAVARDNNLALQIGLLSAVSAYLAHSVVDFNLHIPGNALMFAAIFGMLAQPRERTATGHGWSVQTFLPRVAIPALALWLLSSGLPKLPGEYWTEEARKALRDNRYDACLEAGNKALLHEDRNPELYFYMGEACRARGNGLRSRTLRVPRFAQALGYYDEVLKIFPQDENLWVRRGQVLSSLQRDDEADVAFETAIALDPNLGILHAYYATHLKATGREAQAQAQLVRMGELASVDLSKIEPDPLRVHDLREAAPNVP